MKSWIVTDLRLNFLCKQERACEIVRSVGENAILEKVSSEGLSFAKKPKNSKKQVRPKKGTLPLVVISGI